MWGEMLIGCIDLRKMIQCAVRSEVDGGAVLRACGGGEGGK